MDGHDVGFRHLGLVLIAGLAAPGSGCTTDPGNVGEVDATVEAGEPAWELPLDFRVTDVVGVEDGVVAVGFSPPEDADANATWVVAAVDAQGNPTWTHEATGVPARIAVGASGLLVAGRSHTDWDQALMQLEMLDFAGNVQLTLTGDPGELVDVAFGASLEDGAPRIVAAGNAQENAPGGSGARILSWDLEGSEVGSVEEAPTSPEGTPLVRAVSLVPQLHSGWMLVMEDELGGSYRASYESLPGEPYVVALDHSVRDMSWVLAEGVVSADASGENEVGVMTVGDGLALDGVEPWTLLEDVTYEVIASRPGVTVVGGHQVVGDDSAQAVLQVIDPFGQVELDSVIVPADPWSSFVGVAITDGLVVGALAAEDSALIAIAN